MLQHLIELRRRALYIFFWFIGLFFFFFYLANDIFSWLIKPLLNNLTQQKYLIATQITAPVFTPLRVAADAALLFTVPYALFHLWRFIAPGLYRQEQKNAGQMLLISLFLFFIGGVFCFYLILPFMFQFFLHMLPKEVHFMPDMVLALDFITRMLVVFGLCFQVPLVCVILVQFKVTHLDTLKKVRPYVIVAAFIVGMLLTPPDVLSQIMLAVPLCLLYELGIFFVWIKQPQKVVKFLN